MLTYTVYSEAGGVGKSTLTAGLAMAHTDHGRNVLAIDMDPQDASLTYLVGVDAPRDNPDADYLARHMIGRPRGEFDDLVFETGHGWDLIPTHNKLEELGDLLDTAAEMAEDLGESFAPNTRLRRVLTEATVPDKYDTIIVDPPATAGPRLYNAVDATRSLVVPAEPTGKGMQSIEGLSDIVARLSNDLDITIGVLAVVPNGVGGTSDQERYLERIRSLGFDAPVAFADRSSLFEGCWDSRLPPTAYVQEVRDAYPYERETLEKINDLARHLEGAA